MTSARSPRSVRRAALSGLLGVGAIAALATAGPAFANSKPVGPSAKQPIQVTGIAQASPSTTQPAQISATSITRDPCTAITHVAPNCVPPTMPRCPDGVVPVGGELPCPPPPTYVCPDGSQPLPGETPCPTPPPPPTIIIPQTPPPTIYIQPAPRTDFVIVRPSFTG